LRGSVQYTSKNKIWVVMMTGGCCFGWKISDQQLVDRKREASACKARERYG